jgi:hypothetical protein
LPGGGLSGSELRQVRIGQDGAEGVLALGDGIGAAGSASIESNDDVFVGYSGGNGQLVIEADGVLTLEGSGAELRVGNDAGSTGLAVQYGGSVSTESLFTIGQGGGAEGEYQLNGGSISASGTVRVGGGGGTGTLRIGGNSSLVSSSSLIVGQSDNAGSEGLLEIVGSQATFQIARLTNHLGNDETIRWTADSGGVTPLVIVGSGGALRVELQNASEIAANSGTVGNRMGDGVALSLDLSALSGSQSVTLIDNRTSETVAGYFENGSTGDLYEEGDDFLSRLQRRRHRRERRGADARRINRRRRRLR